MIEVRLPLPCTAADLERAIHNLCDGHGCWPTTVITATETELILTHKEESEQPNKKGK